MTDENPVILVGCGPAGQASRPAGVAALVALDRAEGYRLDASSRLAPASEMSKQEA